ncbi:YtxH domain-containing protein [Pseudarthrobacter sp. WHRI 8279]|uniref:YtxH domain-containing protein n=1 Tax=Pseudarthrobacter sp. WHRI 8279 TaxID=3162566 RepID=UPI0032EDD104
MKTKLVFASGVALGLVLGTKAGRESYEKIKVKLRGFWQDPTVQDKAPELQGQASQTVTENKEATTAARQHNTALHHEGTTSSHSPHDHATADGPESAFYGIGGPASGEAPEAESPHQHPRETGN